MPEENHLSEDDKEVEQLLETLFEHITDGKKVSKADILLSVMRGSNSLQKMPCHLSEIEGAIRKLKPLDKELQWQTSRIRNANRAMIAEVKKLQRDFSTLATLVTIASNLDDPDLRSSDFLKRLTLK